LHNFRSGKAFSHVDDLASEVVLLLRRRDAAVADDGGLGVAADVAVDVEESVPGGSADASDGAAVAVFSERVAADPEDFTRHP
jgi:hypothetical protein